MSISQVGKAWFPLCWLLLITFLSFMCLKSFWGYLLQRLPCDQGDAEQLVVSWIFLLSFLTIGVIFACLQSSGTSPIHQDLSKISETCLAMTSASFLSVCGCIPSEKWCKVWTHCGCLWVTSSWVNHTTMGINRCNVFQLHFFFSKAMWSQDILTGFRA